MSDRPLEPDEPGEPDEPTEATAPIEPEVEEPDASEAQAEPTTEETTEEATTEDATADETTAVAPPALAEDKHLHRSRDDRVIAGVCGGLGKYFGVDTVLVRIAAVLLIFAGGVGILLYVIGWIAMDEEPETLAATGGTPRSAAESELERKRGAVLLGLVFVALGVYFLLDDFWPDVSWQYVWPLALIAVGVAVVARGRR